MQLVFVLRVMKMSNSLVNKLISGAIFNVFNIAIQVVLGLFLFREMLAFLGNEDFALWSVIIALLAHVSLFEFGIGSVISRQVALRDVGKPETNKVLSTAILSLVSLGGIFLLVLAIACVVYSFTDYQQEFSDGSSIIFILVLLALNALLNFISGAFQAYLVGKFYVRSVNAVRLFVNLFRSLGIIFYLQLDTGYSAVIGIAYIYLIAALMEISARYFYSIKAGLKNDFNYKSVDYSTFKKLADRGKKLIFLRINDYVRNNSGILMSSAMLGPLSVVPLRIAGRLMEIFVEILSSINYLLTPYFSNFINEINNNNFNVKFQMSILIASCISLLIYFNILFLSEWFLNVWLGDYPPITLDVLIVLALGFSIANMQGPVTAMLLAKDLNKEISFLSRLEILISLISMFLFIKFYGVIGAAYSITLSLIIVRGFIQSILVGKVLNIPLFEYMKPILLLIFSFGIIFLLIQFIATWISNQLSINFIVTFILLELIIAVSALLIVYVRVIRHEK